MAIIDRFIVIALVNPEGDRERGCRIVPADSIYPAIYRQVFGPASLAECTAWVAEHCVAANVALNNDAEALSSDRGFMIRQFEATGYSNDYSFVDAVKDAIGNLPPDPDPYPDKLYHYRVLESGAQVGGFAGLDRLYVRVAVYY